MKKIFLLFVFCIILFSQEVKYDLLYLKNFAEDNPTDIKSRELLLKYFYKKDDEKMILKYAKELFNLDKENKTLIKILTEYNIKIKKEKLSKIMKKFLKEKAYIRYINLYLALLDTNNMLSNEDHIDALYCAVMSENFSLAKKILKRDDLPMSPKLSSIMKILDKKLGNDINL